MEITDFTDIMSELRRWWMGLYEFFCKVSYLVVEFPLGAAGSWRKDRTRSRRTTPGSPRTALAVAADERQGAIAVARAPTVPERHRRVYQGRTGDRRRWPHSLQLLHPRDHGRVASSAACAEPAGLPPATAHAPGQSSCGSRRVRERCGSYP